MNIFFWTTYSIFAPSGYTMNADASRSKLLTIDNSFSFVTYEPRKKTDGNRDRGRDRRTDGRKRLRKRLLTERTAPIAKKLHIPTDGDQWHLHVDQGLRPTNLAGPRPSFRTLKCKGASI